MEGRGEKETQTQNCKQTPPPSGTAILPPFAELLSNPVPIKGAHVQWCPELPVCRHPGNTYIGCYTADALTVGTGLGISVHRKGGRQEWGEAEFNIKEREREI